MHQWTFISETILHSFCQQLYILKLISIYKGLGEDEGTAYLLWGRGGQNKIPLDAVLYQIKDFNSSEFFQIGHDYAPENADLSQNFWQILEIHFFQYVVCNHG